MARGAKPGERRAAKETHRRMVSLRLSEAAIERLDTLARGRGVTKTDIIEQFILEAPMPDFDQTQQAIAEFRATLADDSQTARAIDRNDAYEDLAICARDEGHDAFAAQMEQAAADWAP